MACFSGPGGTRCPNPAEYQFYDEHSMPVPGNVCAQHAQVVIDEYLQKLGIRWTARHIDGHGGVIYPRGEIEQQMTIVWFDPRQARRARRRERPTPRRVAERWAREDAELLATVGPLVELLAGPQRHKRAPAQQEVAPRA